MCGDTDSVWVACTEEIQFDSPYFPSVSEEYHSTIEGHKLTRKQYELYTPLKWKIEYTGHVMICPRSKSYFADGPDGRKMSCKGAMKHIVEESDTLYQDFLDMVFAGKKEVVCLNRGFRFDNGMTTYTQARSFLNYWYDKSPVGPDLVTLFPGIL